MQLSASTVTKFLLGSRKFKAELILNNKLYGSQKQLHTYGSLKPLVVRFFEEHPAILKKYMPFKEAKPWAGVTYFEQPAFCKLSSKAQDQLKEKINALGIVKETATQPEYIIQTRETFARAYEPWSDTELDYLAKALFYTNDLQVLSACFQRGEGSIISVGKKLLFEGKAKAGSKPA